MTRAANPFRVPPEIKVELGSARDALLPQMQQVINTVGLPPGEAAALANLRGYLADRNAMILNARMGRQLVGFLVLDSVTQASPFSWVDRQFRDKGLGQRFYSFACINLAMPKPQFTFHQDMLSEYAGVLKNIVEQPVLKDPFYVLHERPAAA